MLPIELSLGHIRDGINGKHYFTFHSSIHTLHDVVQLYVKPTWIPAGYLESYDFMKVYGINAGNLSVELSACHAPSNKASL